MVKKIKTEDAFTSLINGAASAFYDVDDDKVNTYDYDDVWRYEPISIEDFCKYFLNEPLWPEQLNFCKAVFGEDPLAFRSLEYDTGLAFWGKGSGKDRTVGKVFTYLGYLCACLINPHKLYGLAVGSPIDFLNLASSADQARDVFFVNFKSLVRMTMDPDTGQNWFATKNFFPVYELNSEGQSVVVAKRFMDLREEKDIQKKLVSFGRLITAHSGNSKTYQGEGKNLVAVAFDELGAFDPVKALGDGSQKQNTDLWGSLRSTVTSRGPYGITMAFSYKYDENCPMSVVVHRAQKEKKTFVSLKAVWKVNITKAKQDFAQEYLKNPEASMMRYECKSKGLSLNRFIRRAYIVEDGINYERENPISGDKVIVNNINTIKFKKFFKGVSGLSYAVHIDGAKGKVYERGDAAGFALVHPKLMEPKFDEKAFKETKLDISLFRKKYAEEGAKAKGIHVDLFVQLVAPHGSELALADIRGLIYFLKKALKFNIRLVTVDGWQSVDTIQQLIRKGYKAEQISVDKNMDAYDTLKELEYQYLIDRYENRTYQRELTELEDQDGKINHPELSNKRAIEEGILKGSKDVTDAVAGACLGGLRLSVSSESIFIV